MSVSRDSEELEVARPPAERSRPARQWRGLTGSLTAGLAVLAVIVLGAGLVCAALHAPGPGAVLLIGHPLAAVLAVLAQRVADRHDGVVAGIGGILVVAIVVAALLLFWWR